ncbi:MAG: LiaF-related protein [Bacteroidetes bacterium]|nr:LiaF-related protein [Bacteroidota bacterium]
MKSKVFFNASFWGIILIVLGCMYLAKEFLPIHIPIFTILISCILIYFGLRLIRGNTFNKNGEDINFFASHNTGYNEETSQYSTVFGESKLDLSDILVNEDKTIDISCVFGSFLIKVSDKLNYKIVSNTVFGKTEMIERSTDGFGSQVYVPLHFNAALPCLTIKTNVVFGEIKFV